MNCPYCNNEMIKGLIHSPQELNWIKGEKRKFFTRAFLHNLSLNSFVASLILHLPSFLTAKKKNRTASEYMTRNK